MNIATFPTRDEAAEKCPTRDASPPLEVAFRGRVWCLRFVLASVRMFSFPQTQIIVTTHACLHLPARLPAPSLYTAAPVSMIGYTTYTFRCRGSDFLVRATETTTSRYRITSLPYQFFLLSPSKHTPPHSTNRVPVH